MFRTISLDNVNNTGLGHIFKMSTSTGVMFVKQMVVSTYSYGTQIEAYIASGLSRLAIREYIPYIQKEEKDGVTFITCFFPEEMPKLKQQHYFEEYIINPVAKAMVEIIQNIFAVEYGNEIIQTKYGFKEIEITAALQGDLETQGLQDSIIDEMVENNSFCLDGWIRFRLSEYKSYIIDMVDNLICEYEAYKEYEEFIMLLKEYTLSQKPLIDQIHIIPAQSGKIDLYDEGHEKFTQTSEKEDDELILGTLLTLAPLGITIHQRDKCNNIRLMDAIQSIYQDKITFCKGCEDCAKPRLNKGIIRVIKDILTQKKL